MFGKRKLLAEGAQAQALVTASGNYPVPSGSAPGRYAVDLRVQFPDGSTAEIQRHVYAVFIDVGDVVPVRYDPADRTKIEIDLPARLATQQAHIDAGRARTLSAGEAEFRRANLVREIAARATPPSDAELQAVADRMQTAREQSRDSIRRYAGSTPSDEQLAETSLATEAFRDARAELDALKALRPDWSPAGTDVD
jgi:hypothetical protein